MLPAGFYESERAVAEYLLFHYGDENTALPWEFGPSSALHFPERCVALAFETAEMPPVGVAPRALDVGCAVGRASFELSRHCREVVGVDRSQRFIEAARHLREHGRLPFRVVEHGTLERTVLARVPDDCHPERVRFETGDALALDPGLGEFEVILAANLLDRVPAPATLLRHLASRLTPNGRLVLTSPYTWLDEFTPRQEWLSGTGPSPLDRIGAVLEPLGLRRLTRADVPFLLREHARKFQWSVAELSIWVAGAGAA